MCKVTAILLATKATYTLTQRQTTSAEQKKNQKREEKNALTTTVAVATSSIFTAFPVLCLRQQLYSCSEYEGKKRRIEQNYSTK